jgi:hypothetical protein
MSVLANQLERRARAEARTHTLLLVRVHRAGGDVDDLVEPEGRTRHAAHWLFW